MPCGLVPDWGMAISGGVAVFGTVGMRRTVGESTPGKLCEPTPPGPGTPSVPVSMGEGATLTGVPTENGRISAYCGEVPTGASRNIGDNGLRACMSVCCGIVLPRTG